MAGDALNIFAAMMDRSEFYEGPKGDRVYGPVMDGIRYAPFGNSLERVRGAKDYPVGENDILVTTFPKSGTNWVLNIVKMLMYKDDLKTDPMKPIPATYFVEVVVPPFPTGYDTPIKMAATHVSPPLLPADVHAGKGRVIYVTRNPKDVVVSGYHFVKTYVEYHESFETFYECFMNGNIYYGDWFNHLIAYHKFMEQRKDQFLIVHYEQLHLEPETQVKRIAAHVGIDVTDQEIAMIMDLCSLGNQRKWVDTVCNREEDAPAKLIFTELYRKGKVGDWKNYFTVAMSERFDAEYERRLAGTGISHVFDLESK